MNRDELLKLNREDLLAIARRYWPHYRDNDADIEIIVEDILDGQVLAEAEFNAVAGGANLKPVNAK